MYTPRMIMKPVALACTVALAACSSSDDAATGTTTISGLAEAPSGVVAQFEGEPSIVLAATDFLFPPAHADITGLEPVGGAAVELIRIDDDGNQVGDVLASTVTSITGDYSLMLPTGVSLAGNLIVRITGNGGASMSAMVVEQAVDINPISQYVLDKFVDDDNLVLGDLALNEVVALTNRVEEFDLTATADLSSMLAELEAQVGELVDTELTVLNSTPDDGSAAAALAGAWNMIEFGLGMHDSETVDFGSLNLEVFSEGLNMTAGTNPGEINLELGVSTFIDTWTGFSVDSLGAAYLYHQTSLDAEVENLTGLIDDGGNIVVEYPFEEDLQTVSIGDPLSDPDGDGPDFGWRWPSGSIAINNVDNSTMVFLDASAGVRYETTDTDGDGINDAVDPNVKAGDETDMTLGLMLKQGSGMSESSLSGDYGLVTVAIDLDTTPAPIGSADSSVGVLTFDGAGFVSVAAQAIDDYGFTRSATTFTDVTLTDMESTDGDLSFPYTVTETGQVTLDTDANGTSAQDLQGWSNDDGSVVALLNVTTEGSDPAINQVSKEMAVVVKLPASAPMLADAVFKLYPIAYGAEESGLTELDTLGSVSSLTFSADATTAAADFKLRGFERATDIAAVEAIFDADEVPFDFDVTLGSNGAIEMSFVDAVTGETNALKGYVTADGNMMVLSYVERDDTDGELFRALGMAFAVKQ
ncbi:MAG: hypothetical protein HKP12_14335 [Gammaproteobacteria bacterium]|nr:hypothetical protein [Gammaproteobacteria bacterium]